MMVAIMSPVLLYYYKIREEIVINDDPGFRPHSLFGSHLYTSA